MKRLIWSYKKSYIFWLFIISGIVYLNTLLMDFVWDDFQQIVFNPLLDNVKYTIFRLFKENLNNNMPIYFRPFFTYSLALDTVIWGKQNPAGFHLTNILLNTTVVLLSYFVLLKLEVSPLSAFVATVIFAVHPVHNEVVALISARNELLSALFMLSSFLVYVSELSSKKVKIVTASLLYFFALQSKENALFFPFLLIFYDRVYSGLSWKDVLRRTVPFLIMLIGYLTLRYVFLPLPFGFRDPLSQRLSNFVIATVHYIKSVFIPVKLKVLYDIKPDRSTVLISAVALIILLSVALTLMKVKKDRRIAFFYLFFLIILLPASNLFSILRPAAVADRYNYLPSLGIITIVVLLLERLFNKEEDKMSVGGKFFYGIVVLYLGITTLQRNWKWENYVVFAQEMVANAPESSFAYNNLGISYTLANRYDLAEEAFKKTLELQPNHDGALYGLGRIYFDQGRYEEAARFFKAVSASKPFFADAHYYLAESYRRVNLFEYAEKSYLNAIKANPEYDLAYAGLGEIYLSQGRYEAAAKAYQTALKIAPWQKDYETKLNILLKRR